MLDSAAVFEPSANDNRTEDDEGVGASLSFSFAPMNLDAFSKPKPPYPERTSETLSGIFASTATGEPITTPAKLVELFRAASEKGLFAMVDGRIEYWHDPKNCGKFATTKVIVVSPRLDKVHAILDVRINKRDWPHTYWQGISSPTLKLISEAEKRIFQTTRSPFLKVDVAIGLPLSKYKAPTNTELFGILGLDSNSPPNLVLAGAWHPGTDPAISIDTMTPTRR